MRRLATTAFRLAAAVATVVAALAALRFAVLARAVVMMVVVPARATCGGGLAVGSFLALTMAVVASNAHTSSAGAGRRRGSPRCPVREPTSAEPRERRGIADTKDEKTTDGSAKTIERVCSGYFDSKPALITAVGTRGRCRRIGVWRAGRAARPPWARPRPPWLSPRE